MSQKYTPSYTEVTTLQYRANASRAGHQRLEKVLLDSGHLYNNIMAELHNGSKEDHTLLTPKEQTKYITSIRQHQPHWTSCDRRLMDQTAQRARGAFFDALKAAKRPAQTKDPHRFQTLQTSEPRINHLKFSPNGKKATVHIKGLPVIKFKPDYRLPTNEQPREIKITNSPRGIQVNLTFPLPVGPPIPPHLQSVGLDPGRKLLMAAVSDDGSILIVPGRDDSEHRKKTRRIKRKMQRQRDQALADGRARWTTQTNRSGQTKRRFRWIGKPSKEYLKCIAKLRKVEQKKQLALRGLHHRISNQLVKDHAVLCLEDTKTSNMVRSAKGTEENPGSNVRQKSGLNREILSQGWYIFRVFLDYKCQRHGRILVFVPAPYTSITCSRCGHRDKQNRKYQKLFHCLSCGFRTNADLNAAENIRSQGLEILASADEYAGCADRMFAVPPSPTNLPHGGEGYVRTRPPIQTN